MDRRHVGPEIEVTEETTEEQAEESLMAKVRSENTGIHRHYGVSRARRFAAKLQWKQGAGRRARKRARASRVYNMLRAKGKR